MKPFLTFGTLLGYYRDQRFIDHDDDIDLGLLEMDWPKVDDLKNRMERVGYKIGKYDQYVISFTHPVSDSLHIDFFLFYRQQGRIFVSSIEQDAIYHYAYPQIIFDNFVEATFLDITVTVPEETELFLSTSYGNWKKETKAFDYRSVKSCPNLVYEDRTL